MGWIFRDLWLFTGCCCWAGREVLGHGAAFAAAAPGSQAAQGAGGHRGPRPALRRHQEQEAAEGRLRGQGPERRGQAMDLKAVGQPIAHDLLLETRGFEHFKLLLSHLLLFHIIIPYYNYFIINYITIT